MSPLVTIGLPFLDAAATLPLALQSVFAQTETRWELILMDDGSQDASLEIARAVRDPRVRVVADGQNRSLAARLNQIAHLANAPLLARFDADDLMHPERLALQRRAFEAQPGLDVLGTAAYIVDDALAVLGVRTPRLHARATEVAIHGLFIHPTILGRTAWFQANPYDETFKRAQDLELWCRTVEQARFGMLETPLLFYREQLKRGTEPYRRGRALERQLVRGLSHVPARVRQRLVARSYAREWTYLGLRHLGLGARLIARRQQPLTLHDRVQAGAALERIAATDVPGLG